MRGDALFDGLDAVKVHHFQRNERLTGQIGTEKAQPIEFLGLFVAAHLGKRTCLLGANLNVEGDVAIAPRQTAEGQEYRLAVLAGDAHGAAVVVELTDELDDQRAHLGKGAITALDEVTAELAARLLQGGDGRGRGDTGIGAALSKITVAAGLLELLDLVLQMVCDERGQRFDLDLPEIVGVEPAGNVDEIAGKVGKFLLVDTARIAIEPARPTGQTGIV